MIQDVGHLGGYRKITAILEGKTIKGLDAGLQKEHL